MKTKIITFALIVLSGCGDVATGEVVNNATANEMNASNNVQALEQQCRSTMKTMCARNVMCAVELGKLSYDSGAQVKAQSDCEAGARTTLDCSRVYKINGNPNNCVIDINNTPCNFWSDDIDGLLIPASCKNLFIWTY